MREPKILALRGRDLRLILLRSSVAELETQSEVRASRKSVLDLVQEAQAKGIIEIAQPPGEPSLPSSGFRARSELPEYLRISPDYPELARYAIQVARDNPGDKVFVAAEHAPTTLLPEAFQLDNLELIDLSELRLGFVAGAAFDQDLLHKARGLVRQQQRGLLVNIVAGVIAGALLIAAAIYIDIIIATISVWGTVVAIFLLGFLFYWARGRYRLTYGIAEFLIGYQISINVLVPDFDYAKLDAVAMLQIVGGLYVMVRALDNIGKGLKGTRWENRWQRVFGTQ